MDKFSKPQDILGQKETEDTVDWNQYCKPKHLYEGTDSEDDEVVTSRVRARSPKFVKRNLRPDIVTAPVLPPSNDFQEFQLQQGELAVEGESFCPFQTIKKYPYVYIGNANRHRVAEGFFDHGKLYERTWDFFYLYRSSAVDASQTALILVPTKQFELFLQTININLGTNLTIPGGGANGGFQVTFENDGTPRPRYLGRATNKDMAENLRTSAPPSYYVLDGEPEASGTPSERSLSAFKTKIDLMLQAQKGKKLANKEKQKTERIAKQQNWGHSIKRVQRYLGIRKASHDQQMALIRKGLENTGLDWEDYDAAVRAAAAKLPPSTNFNPEEPAPYEPEGSVVFVCVDVEAYERNNSQITEIGIATLDTADLKSATAGEGGVNWMELIRTRHFRINEYKHLKNSEFVEGCADRFEFGESEFINLKDAPHVLASCFKHPFSKPDEKPTATEPPKRNIILVGHDVGADINFLRMVGYDVHNLSNLQEIVDTASMWRYVKRDTNPRNLGSILAELDIIGWNLHNAGNDAAYTLQVMVKIAIKDLGDRQKVKETREGEVKQRIAESVKDATIAAWEREQGWSSGGENSDGGWPVTPKAPTSAVKKDLNSQSSVQSKITNPWRPTNQSLNADQQSQNTSLGAITAKEPPHKTSYPPEFGFPTPKSHSWGEAFSSEERLATNAESRLADLMNNTKLSAAEKEAVENNNTETTSTSNNRGDDEDFISWK